MRQNVRPNRFGNTIGKIKASVSIDEMNIGFDKDTGSFVSGRNGPKPAGHF